MIIRKKDISKDKTLGSRIGFAMGIIVFIIIYGVKILNPFYVDWLLGQGDLSQHYLGWEFYRRDQWRFPLGLTEKLAYPIKTSVIFTDSIPFLAVFFKIFNGILPSQFQYFGIWGLLSFGLQGYFSTKIFNILKVNKYAALVGNLFMLLSPIMIYRMYMHTSLAGHWIILGCFYLLLRHAYDYTNTKFISIIWGIVGFLIVGIHIYFVPMCFFFLLGYIVLSTYEFKKICIESVLPLVCFLVGIIFNTWILGGFSSNAHSDADGLGDYSLNLNSFINPNGYSKLLSNLERLQFQHEGFAYFGFGLLIIVGIGIITFFVRLAKGRKATFESAIILVIALVSMLFAISPVFSCGGTKLFEIPIPDIIEKLWGTFRSTGRFVWVTWYIIAFFAVKEVSSLKLKKVSAVDIGILIIIICAAIQIYDISGVLIGKHKRFANTKTFELSNTAFWDAAVQYRDFKHVNMAYQVKDYGEYMQIATYALQYGLDMDSFYFARNIDGMYEHKDALEREGYRADTIYVFKSDDQEQLEHYVHILRYYDLDKYVIGISWLDETGQVNDFVYENE